MRGWCDWSVPCKTHCAGLYRIHQGRTREESTVHWLQPRPCPPRLSMAPGTVGHLLPGPALNRITSPWSWHAPFWFMSHFLSAYPWGARMSFKEVHRGLCHKGRSWIIPPSTVHKQCSLNIQYYAKRQVSLKTRTGQWGDCHYGTSSQTQTNSLSERRAAVV